MYFKIKYVLFHNIPFRYASFAQEWLFLLPVPADFELFFLSCITKRLNFTHMNKSGEETILSLPERHNRILALLQQNGSISVAQLAELFKVSEVTIRKDLSYLEQQKKLYRTHGSAILISPYISDRHVNEKEKKNVAEKRAIGAKAASLIAQDDSIIIASGTTMAFLAREIKPVGHLTVITAAVPVTSILSQDANIDVIQLGGITRSSSVSVVGPLSLIHISEPTRH